MFIIYSDQVRIINFYITSNMVIYVYMEPLVCFALVDLKHITDCVSL